MGDWLPKDEHEVLNLKVRSSMLPDDPKVGERAKPHARPNALWFLSHVGRPVFFEKARNERIILK
jgi:hypothetical protein